MNLLKHEGRHEIYRAYEVRFIETRVIRKIRLIRMISALDDVTRMIKLCHRTIRVIYSCVTELWQLLAGYSCPTALWQLLGG